MDLRRIDLNLLVSLQALLDEEHVSAAARRMSVTQPSMSATLARLRTLLDDPILVRAGRALVPTPFADSLRDPLHAVLTDIDQLLSDRPTFDPATDARTFVVAATDYMTFVFLQKVVAALPRLAADVRLAIEPVTPGYSAALRAGDLDLLVLPHEVATDIDDMSSEVLFEDTFTGIASAVNDEVCDLTVAHFTSMPYLAYRVNGERSYVDGRLDAAGVRPRVEMTTESFLIPPLVIGDSRMVSLVHRRATEMLPSLPLRLFAPPVDIAPITQRMYWHSRRTADPAHAWLRSVFARLAAAERD